MLSTTAPGGTAATMAGTPRLPATARTPVENGGSCEGRGAGDLHRARMAGKDWGCRGPNAGARVEHGIGHHRVIEPGRRRRRRRDSDVTLHVEDQVDGAKSVVKTDLTA